MEAGVPRQAAGGRQSGCMFQRDGRIQQPAIKDHPTLRRLDAVAVAGRYVDGAPCEGFEIDPWEMPSLRRPAPATRSSCQAPREFGSLVKQVRPKTSTSRPLPSSRKGPRAGCHGRFHRMIRHVVSRSSRLDVLRLGRRCEYPCDLRFMIDGQHSFPVGTVQFDLHAWGRDFRLPHRAVDQR